MDGIFQCTCIGARYSTIHTIHTISRTISYNLSDRPDGFAAPKLPSSFDLPSKNRFACGTWQWQGVTGRGTTRRRAKDPGSLVRWAAAAAVAVVAAAAIMMVTAAAGRSDHDGDRGRSRSRSRSRSSSSSSSSEDSEERLEREREREFREQESQEKRAQKKAARKAERERAEAAAQAERQQAEALQRLGRTSWRFTAAGDEDDDCFSLNIRGKKPESVGFFVQGTVDCTSWEPLHTYLREEDNFNMPGALAAGWLLAAGCWPDAHTRYSLVTAYIYCLLLTAC